MLRASMLLWERIALGLLACTSSVAGIALNTGDPASIKAAASTIAYGMMSSYTGNLTGGTPGMMPYPTYYWWESGAAWGAMLDYYYYTGDPTYNDVISEALLFQVGPNNDYMPPNQTSSEGNDDQAFWGFAVMSAAEQNFPNPPANQPQWLALAQAVFNSMAGRWDAATCNGGLRWQIYPFNNGYTYKNSIANGGLFNLAARLAKYTGNSSYADWADKEWDWITSTPIFTIPGYDIYDGASIAENCSQPQLVKWTYNTGVFLLGAATMYNYTNGSSVWQQRVQGLFDATAYFFNNASIMYEPACEPYNNCDTDQDSFKAYLSRWMAASTQVAPFLYDQTMALLTASAAAAAEQCSGGTNGVTCGSKWTNGPVWDGTSGVGQQMSALEVIQSLLVANSTPPLTSISGGTSKGDPSAGTGVTPAVGVPNIKITTGDSVAAWFLTIFSGVAVGGTSWWIMTGL